MVVGAASLAVGSVHASRLPEPILRSIGSTRGRINHFPPVAGEEAGLVHGYFGGYGLVALLALLGVGFLALGMGANRLLRPWRTVPEKLLTYESGVDPV